jgi:RNA polymerase sigma-70 factor (ECF subfamily)
MVAVFRVEILGCDRSLWDNCDFTVVEQKRAFNMAETETGAMSTSGEPQDSSYGEFLSLFSRHSRRIYGFIRILVIDANDANDVYQNTAMCLWQKFDNFSPGTSFFAWACQVAQREVLKFRHQKSRHRHFPEELVDLLAANFRSRIDELDRREESLAECMKQLRAEDQVLLEQRYVHDRKPMEMAAAQSCSVHSIYRALSKIHDQLLRCIARTMKERH